MADVIRCPRCLSTGHLVPRDDPFREGVPRPEFCDVRPVGSCRTFPPHLGWRGTLEEWKAGIGAAPMPPLERLFVADPSTDAPAFPAQAPDDTADPRPDLESDSVRWAAILTLANDEYGPCELIDALRWIRVGGTCIVARNYQGTPRWRLRPLVDPARGWTTEEEYTEARNKYLKPYAQEVAYLLERLEEVEVPILDAY